MSNWSERQTKIQAKFPGDHDGGPLARCLCFQCSSMFEAAPSRLRQTPSSHSNMCRGSAHFSHVCFHKKKKKKTACDGKSGQLLRAITVALLQLQRLPVDIHFRNDRPPPASGCSQVRSGCERETRHNFNCSVNEELLDSEESVSSKDQTVAFYFTSLCSCAVCWRISS